MTATLLLTDSIDFAKFRSVNSNSSSFPTKNPVAAEPSGDAGTAAGACLIDLRKDAGRMSNGIILIPYGLGSSNDGFSMRVLGWKAVRKGQTDSLWLPVPLCEVACLLGAMTGLAGAAVLNTECFCDTITGVTNKFNNNVTVAIASPADDTIGHLTLDLEGYSKIELIFDQTTNTPTMNALYSLL